MIESNWRYEPRRLWSSEERKEPKHPALVSKPVILKSDLERRAARVWDATDRVIGRKDGVNC